MTEQQIYSVSDAIAVINQTLEYAYPNIAVEGEIANFKISGGKWVFFDLKDEQGSLRCFMTAWNLRVALADGMKVLAVAKPRLGKYGFSLNIDQIKPVGAGSIKQAFDLLCQKLETEGLFAPERKRPLPAMPLHIGVISSIGAAGYQDFLKILNHRFGGLDITVANTAVQGDSAPNQIIRALNFFNESPNPPEVIVIIRGGGSRDDLSAFDDEPLVRAIASSRLPTLVGVGHEVDLTLADLAADVRASTPSNAAEILIPDKREIAADLSNQLRHTLTKLDYQIERTHELLSVQKRQIKESLQNQLDNLNRRYQQLSSVLSQVNPRVVLRRGYAIVRAVDGKILQTTPQTGQKLQIETAHSKILATVNSAQKTP
ncbi:MAG: exodeoxyribonuclease VII large subunit [Candidatus Nomurabacteria bacterium]|jgi:exodeoxyribonuclease VII large subunit|nr:exodeoxyribonuclease VII large subunit [Candidatus Nomurabacteria bacterium]